MIFILDFIERLLARFHVVEKWANYGIGDHKMKTGLCYHYFVEERNFIFWRKIISEFDNKEKAIEDATMHSDYYKNIKLLKNKKKTKKVIWFSYD